MKITFVVSTARCRSSRAGTAGSRTTLSTALKAISNTVPAPRQPSTTGEPSPQTAARESGSSTRTRPRTSSTLPTTSTLPSVLARVAGIPTSTVAIATTLSATGTQKMGR